jgi:CRISPR-associated endonuclease/helicase Cas3
MPYPSRISEDQREQDTAQHLQEVSALARGFGQTFGLGELCAAAGLVHDLGKLSAAFGEYLRKGGPRGSLVHSTQGARYVYNLGQAEEKKVQLAACITALCVAGHHGGLMDVISPQGVLGLQARLRAQDPNQHDGEAVAAFQGLGLDRPGMLGACAAELDDFFKGCGQTFNRPFMMHLLVKTVFSCLVDADRYNAYCFETNLPPALPSIPPWDALHQRLEAFLLARNQDPSRPQDPQVRQARREISAQARDAAENPQGVFRLDAPTGGGKTLASLRFALCHAHKHGLARIFYVIPYLSVLEQVAAEIHAALGVGPDNALVLEHHSNIVVRDEAEDGKHRLLTQRWDSPIIVTTAVRFLESVYSSKSGDLRRFHACGDAVLIFDEVQALPLKCMSLFNEAVNYLAAFGHSTVVLCSATQPPFEKLLHSIRLPITPILTKAPALPKRAVVLNRTTPDGYTMPELRDFVLERMETSHSCLVIFNTKKDAKKFFRGLPKRQGIRPFHLSTALCPAHRAQVLQTLRGSLEAPGSGPGDKPLCVSTQLIEAGVDISFETVVRVLAGLDSVVQGAGRCNRHGSSRTPGEVYLVKLRGETLKFLPSIEIGAQVTKRILNDFPDGDLLAAEPLAAFFEHYFFKQERLGELDYPVPRSDGGGTLYDWLSENKRGFGWYTNGGGQQIQLPGLCQAFGTAGKNFSVFDKETTGVIAPYGEAPRLLDQYAKGGLSEQYKQLRQLQPYTVSLFHHEFAALRQAGALRQVDGLWALKYPYYHQDLGVTHSLEEEETHDL